MVAPPAQTYWDLGLTPEAGETIRTRRGARVRVTQLTQTTITLGRLGRFDLARVRRSCSPVNGPGGGETNG